MCYPPLKKAKRAKHRAFFAYRKSKSEACQILYDAALKAAKSHSVGKLAQQIKTDPKRFWKQGTLKSISTVDTLQQDGQITTDHPNKLERFNTHFTSMLTDEPPFSSDKVTATKNFLFLILPGNPLPQLEKKNPIPLILLNLIILQ